MTNRNSRLMNKNNIFSRLKRKYKATTYSNQNLNIARNLLKQHFTVEVPNKVCVGDLMYIGTGECWIYLI